MSAARCLLAETLRLLTLDEINQLTTVTEADEVCQLTKLVDDLLKDDCKAKIIPFTKPDNASPPPQVAPAAPEIKIEAPQPTQQASVPETKTEVIVDENDPTKIFFKKEEKVQDKENIDVNVFILGQRDKLKKSQGKLKEMEVLQLYKKSASVDIDQEKGNKTDLSKCGNSGILINKKQN